jgi:hypothetical protein
VHIQIETRTADAPGRPLHRSCQRRAYLRTAMKAALRTAVAAVCAGSLAVNAMAMPPDQVHGSTEVAGTGTTVGAVAQAGAAIAVAAVAQRADDNHGQGVPGFWPRGPEAQAVLAEVLVANQGVWIARVLSATYGSLAYNTTSRWDVAQQRIAPAVTQAVWFSLGTLGTYSVRWYLQHKRGFSESQAIWISNLVPLACIVGSSVPINIWDQKMTAKVDRYRPDELRRKLLQIDDEVAATPGSIGNLMADWAYMAATVEINTQNEAVFPRTAYCPKTKVALPRYGEFRSIDGTISIPAWEWKYNTALSRTGWVPRNTIKITPGALAQLPVKVVSDGNQVWMLSKRGTYGYSIWKRKDHANWRDLLNNNPGAWTNVTGEVIDIFPGPTTVWATNSEGKIFACRKPCDGQWVHMTGGGSPSNTSPSAREVAISKRSYITTSATARPRVWIKDMRGNVWSRDEDMQRLDHWDRVLGPSPRARDLLNERDALMDWLDRNRFRYPPIN